MELSNLRRITEELALSIAREKGVSNWLNAYPLKKNTVSI